MIRKEYAIEIIRGLCERNEIKWRENTKGGGFEAEINECRIAIYEGWWSLAFSNLIFMELGNDPKNLAIIMEPPLKIRPNSPADKLRNFICEKILKTRRYPDAFEKASTNMQFILEYAKTHVAISESDRDASFRQITGFK